ncbi:MAG: heparinase II/III family protein [Prolixibacteraceae bacterium]|nr:heparinase II/III family protein [Prolixibacteraceae bacterium]
MKKHYLLICWLLCAGQLLAQNPHILVSNDDKQEVLAKIKQQAWAKTIYSEMQKSVTPYADRHQTDPQWILSRYLMNRVPGKRYTKVYSDKGGQRLVKWEGNAPVPTVRVNTYLRTPITEKGTSYRKPTIEELVPNDTARLMNLFNPETNQKEWTDPQAYITSINGEINDLALDAAILYWLTGEAKYARFAADILDQWAKGAFYQEPIIGPCRTGFLDMQTLGDQSFRALILAYDFLKLYMRQQNYDLHWYEPVFEKFASTLAFRGFWNNNWYAAESSTLTFAALSLENKQKRDYYLQFILEKDTINGGCGQLAFPSTVEKWLTHDGHWKEPGGYHNYPVGNLLVSAMALEKNGYDIFRKFPAMFRASYAMLKYSFPNLTVGAFGDTGRASQSAESLEIGLLGAVKYNQPELPEMLASMKQLTDGGIYKREKSGFLGLLCFLPEIPEAKTAYQWPRTGTLEFARYFLQRNGTDPKTGLMVGVQEATYNHNHCNGMAMELYGIGEVWGIDAGTGPNYEHPLHQNYYSQWAAHNTVVAAGMSSAVPFSGSAGTKNVGQIDLAAMEPMPDESAVSPSFSFTDTRYFDKSTKTNQSRTLGIVRTSEKTGYYVDIYRSDNTISNDYVYHNIGDAVSFLNEKREPLKTVEANYPVTEKDYPGFRFYTEVKKLEKYDGNLIARFDIQDENQNKLFMHALISGTGDRDYFQAMSPKTKTAGKQYNGKPLPLFTIRTGAEAKSRPFVVVFEPYREESGNSVERISVEKRADSDVFTALTVFCKGGLKQQIFQSVDPNQKFTSGTGNFSGYYGIAGFEGEKLTSIYLGKGTEILQSGYSLKSKTPDGSANLAITGKNLIISCSQETEVGLPLTAKKVWMKQGSIRKELPVSKSAKGILITVPAVENGEIVLE